MKTYSQASEDVTRTIERVRAEYYFDELQGVTVAALFVFDLEATEPVLTHQGYPAAAVTRITPIRDRALGVADAVIVIDRTTWLLLSAGQRAALVDHELHHLERVVDEETESPKFDAVDRPKLAIRKHSHQIGVFSEVMRRHGKDSMEMRQINQLMDDAAQMDLFAPEHAAPSSRLADLAQRIKDAGLADVVRAAIASGPDGLKNLNDAVQAARHAELESLKDQAIAAMDSVVRAVPAAEKQNLEAA